MSLKFVVWTLMIVISHHETDSKTVQDYCQLKYEKY